MLRKNLSFLASMFAVLMLLGMQKSVKAEGVYSYTTSGSSSVLYAQVYAYNDYGSPSGYINLYQGSNTYAGFIMGVQDTMEGSTKVCTVTSLGFLNNNYYDIAYSTYVCKQDASGNITVSATVSNSAASMGSGLSGTSWGYAYIW